MSTEALGWDLVFDLKGDGLTRALKDTGLLNDQLALGGRRMIEFESGGKRVKIAMEDSMGSAQRSTRKLRDEIDSVTVSLHSFNTSLAGVSVTAQGKLGAVLGVVQQIGHALGAGFRALDTFGDRAISANADASGTLRAYTALLGDRHQAEVEFYKAQQLSQKTDLTASQVEGAQKTLMVAGFRGPQLDSALAAVADMGAMAGPKDREMMVERSGRALSQIFSKGKLQGEELRQLAEAGLSRKLVLEELQGSKYGGNAAAVEKSISKGKVSGDEGIAAIERALLKQFGTSKLGEFATGSSGTLSGVMSNRDEAVQNLLKSYDAELLPGMERYKEALKQQAALFDRNTKSGSEMAYTLQSLTDTSSSVKAAWEQFTTGFYESFSASYNEVMRALGIGNEQWDATAKNARELGLTLGLEVGGTLAHLTEMARDLAPALTAIDVVCTVLVGSVRVLYRTLTNLADLIRGVFYDLTIGLSPGNVPTRFKDWGQRQLAIGQAEVDSYNKKDDLIAAAEYGRRQREMDELLAPKRPETPTLLRRPSWQQDAPHKGGGGSGGAGSGGGGTFGNFVPDYSLLTDGVALPMTAPAGPGYQVELQRALSSSMAQREEQRQAELKQIIEEVSVTIQIDGAGKSSEEIAAQVELRLLQRVGRFARTPTV